MNEGNTQGFQKLVEQYNALNARYAALKEQEERLSQTTDITEEERAIALHELRRKYAQAAEEMKWLAECAQLWSQEAEEERIIIEEKVERYAQLSKEIEKLKLVAEELAVEKMGIWERIDRGEHIDEQLALHMEELCDQAREIEREKNTLAIEKENIRIQIKVMQVGHRDVGNLAESANYQFACSFMLEAFFKTKIKMESLYKNESMTDLFYMSVLRGMRSYVGFSQKYRNLPTYYVKNKKGKGVVFGIPDANEECECNYVALLEWENGERTYYTSEYYAMDGGFKLCEYTLDQHYAYDIRTDSLESFVKTIGFKVDGHAGGLYFHGIYGGFRGLKEWIKNTFKAYRLRKIRKDRKRLELKEETLGKEAQGESETPYLEGD